MTTSVRSFTKACLRYHGNTQIKTHTCAHTHTQTHTHTHTQTHTQTHTHTDIQGLRGGTLGGCFFTREESYDHYFHSNGSWYHDLGCPKRILHGQGQQIRIQCYDGHYQSPGRSLQKMTKTHTKTRTKRFLSVFLLIAQNALKTMKNPNLEFSLRRSSS